MVVSCIMHLLKSLAHAAHFLSPFSSSPHVHVLNVSRTRIFCDSLFSVCMWRPHDELDTTRPRLIKTKCAVRLSVLFCSPCVWVGRGECSLFHFVCVVLCSATDFLLHHELSLINNYNIRLYITQLLNYSCWFQQFGGEWRWK